MKLAECTVWAALVEQAKVLRLGAKLIWVTASDFLTILLLKK